MGFLGSTWFLMLSVAGSVLLSLLGLLGVRKVIDRGRLEAHHGVAGSFMSIVGTLYAVVLGFIVVDALNTFQKSRVLVETEANSLHDVFHIAGGLPSTEGRKIRGICFEYAKEMINGEWPAMEHGESSQNAHVLMLHLWHEAINFRPNSMQEQNLDAAMIDQMHQIGDARHSRLLAARPAYEPVVWMVLIIGAVVTIVFTYFFGFESLSLQLVMTALVAVVLSLNLVLVALFRCPFSGDVKVSPAPFKVDLDSFANEMNER